MPQVIRIPGYIADEKVHIARQYLEPQSMRESGVPEAAASISDAAMHTLIHEYARRAPSFFTVETMLAAPLYPELRIKISFFLTK